MRQILLLGLCLAVVRGVINRTTASATPIQTTIKTTTTTVTVSNSSCGSSYSLNGLNDEMTLEYNGGQLQQRCSVAISTSQPRAYLCFAAKFKNINSTLSYKVEYHELRVTNYGADKVIDRVSETSEWCVSSSNVFVVFVSGRGSSYYPPEIEIKIKSRANLCFAAKFENVYSTLYSTLSYKVEYHANYVTNYADKTIDRISHTSKWCPSSSKVAVVFVPGRVSFLEPDIEIKVKVTFDGSSSDSGSSIGGSIGSLVLVACVCFGIFYYCHKRQRGRRGQVVDWPPNTTAQTSVQVMVTSPPTQAVYQGYPPPSQTGYQPQQGYPPPLQTGYQPQQGYPPPSQTGYQPQQGYIPPLQTGYQPQQGYPQTAPAGYQPNQTGYQPGGYTQQTSYSQAAKAGYPPDQTGYPHEPQKGYAGKQRSAPPSYSPSAPPPPSVPPQPSVPPPPSVPPQPSVPPPPYSP
ncbi:hypothetical protein DPMN_004314 [Dreissena polymorpha]|uniref:Uncharacterized protein n=1 Tax=Dreissena polymorpha TaxID=45954 RepID=A0A9D4MN95_DREPO|nr:hypothetical protein DPMN_004314 [Dreissena polymorpha]